MDMKVMTDDTKLQLIEKKYKESKDAVIARFKTILREAFSKPAVLLTPETYQDSFSENAQWLWAERYYVMRYDSSVSGGLRKEKTIYEVVQRVTRSLVCEERQEDYIFDGDFKEWLANLESHVMADLLEKRFMFGSPVLFNAGFANVKDPDLADLYYAPIGSLTAMDYVKIRQAKHKGQMMCSCFTLPVNDMLESDGTVDHETNLASMGIFNSVMAAGRISQSGGGVGTNFSKIRPKGYPIGEGDSGYASGPVSFMKLWDTAGEVIVQGGKRRAALMGILDSDHPDILEFIDAKTQEGVLPYFNISVNVKEDLASIVTDPSNREGGIPCRTWGDEKIKVIDATTLWDKLCQSAWKRGDPGFLCLDMAQRDNIMQLDSRYLLNTSNPCVVGDTWVMTDKGARQVKDLVGVPFNAITHGEAHASTDQGFWQSGVKDVMTIKCKEGHKLTCTPDHKVAVLQADNSAAWVPAGQLRLGVDKIVLHDHTGVTPWEGRWTRDQGYLAGCIVGNGSILDDQARAEEWRPTADGDVRDTDPMLLELRRIAFTFSHRDSFQGWNISKTTSTSTTYRLQLLAFSDFMQECYFGRGNKNIAPELEKEASYDFYVGFLAGLFDTDGSVQGTSKKGYSIRLSQSNLAFIQAAQRMMARIGIRTTTRLVHNARFKAMPDGKGGLKDYWVEANYELLVPTSSIRVFAKTIKLYHPIKSTRMAECVHFLENKSKVGPVTRPYFVTPTEIVYHDEPVPVYDCTIHDVHAFDANGLYISNCGERIQPLFSACLLGSINVDAMAHDIMQASGEALNKDTYRWACIKDHTHPFTTQIIRATYYMDLMVDASTYPLPEIRDVAERSRPIGLGLMGLANLFLKSGLEYGNLLSQRMTENIFASLAGVSMFTTIALGALKGAFPDADAACRLMSCWHPNEAWTTQTALREAQPLLSRCVPESNFTEETNVKVWTDAVANNRWLRNSSRLSVAPNGSISMLLDTSGGIEPNFAWHWTRRMKSKDGVTNVERTYWHPLVLEGYKKDILAHGVHPSEDCKHWKTANELPYHAHLTILGIAAAYVDSGISKTINLPEHALVDDVDYIYKWALKNKVKGLTVYRDGSRREQPIEAIKKEPAKPVVPETTTNRKLKKRPPLAAGLTNKSGTPWGSLYTTLTFGDDGKPFEVFVTLGKSGSELKSFTEALSRVISVALRSGSEIEDILSTLDGLSGQEIWVIDDPKDKAKEYVVKSIPDALAKSLRIIMGSRLPSSDEGQGTTEVRITAELQSNTVVQSTTDIQDNTYSKYACPECGSPTITIGGCPYCLTCGWSKCK